MNNKRIIVLSDTIESKYNVCFRPSKLQKIGECFFCLEDDMMKLPKDNAIGWLAIYHIHLVRLRIEVMNYRLRYKHCAIYLETLK